MADKGDGQVGDDGKSGGGDGDDKKKGPRFPRVLLSNHDTDPLHPELGQKVNCDPRHPPVYQRDEDVAGGVFWINTQAPFAQRTLDRYGVETARWRDYMFHRFVEIIIKQAIYDAQKKQLQLTASAIDNLLDDIHKRVYADAAEGLYGFLFRDRWDSDTVIDDGENPLDDALTLGRLGDGSSTSNPDRKTSETGTSKNASTPNVRGSSLTPAGGTTQPS